MIIPRDKFNEKPARCRHTEVLAEDMPCKSGADGIFARRNTDTYLGNSLGSCITPKSPQIAGF
jgi:hypothetical protein